MFFTKHGYQGEAGKCQELGRGGPGGRGLPGETEEGGEEEPGGVEQVGPAHDAHDGLHVEGVAAKQGAAHQTQQPGVGGLGQPGECSEEEIQQEGVGGVQDDVQDFVLFRCDAFSQLALKAERESCQRSVRLRISFNQSVQPGKPWPKSR